LLFFGTVYIYSEIGLKVGFESDTLVLPEEPLEAQMSSTVSLGVFNMVSTEE